MPDSRPPVEVRYVPIDWAQVRAVLDEMEAKYGVPSHRLTEPFTRRTLILRRPYLDETEDFVRWSRAWSLWRPVPRSR